MDAIQFQQLNRCTIAELSRGDVSLIVDRGVRSVQDAEELFELGVDKIVVALETLSGPALARELADCFGSERLILSLDLRHSEVLTTLDQWKSQPPLHIAQELASLGFQQFIVLDLASVGTNGGIPTLPLCRELRALLPTVQLITGGGVRGIDDLRDAAAAGVDATLVASALHDGCLTADDLLNLQG